MRQNLLKLLLLGWALTLSFTIHADGDLPLYYELVTDFNELEAGKHYLIVAKYASTMTQKPYVAYNGYSSGNSTGQVGPIDPMEEEPGGRLLNYPIVNCRLSANQAKPIKLVRKENSTDLWHIIDGATGLYLGASNTVGPTENYVCSDYAPSSVLFDWKITYEYDDEEECYFWYVRNMGKGDQNYYLKYNDNNGAGLFRLYPGKKLEDMANIVQVYKEMEPRTVNVGFTGYGTLYYGTENLLVADVNGTPTDVVAHPCSYGDMFLEYVTSYAADYVIPMNHAVVVRGLANTAYEFYVTKNTSPSVPQNALKGRDTQGLTTADGDCLFYKLTTRGATEGIDNGTTGFYWGAAEGAAFTIPAHKAYLALERSVAQNISEFLLEFAQNGILPPETGHRDRTDGPVFDLQGRRMDGTAGLRKGIYVVKGRKVVIR